MAGILCPNCKSSYLYRSRTRGFKEKVQKWTGRKAYRCPNCKWRGLLGSKYRRPFEKHFGSQGLNPWRVFAFILILLMAFAAWTSYEWAKWHDRSDQIRSMERELRDFQSRK